MKSQRVLIEKKWQRIWEKNKLYRAKDFEKKPKYYILDMFPYPSSEGLHVGHPRSYTATDVVYRLLKMKGFNVLQPMGWDAFGLPAENYALKTGIHPKITTKKNIGRYKKQLQAMGLAYDWSREINTTDPEYYKWTQWIFLKMFENGLAYKKEAPINWCPSCKTGLANEEVTGGKCNRCGRETIRKTLSQWILKITAYAERLLQDLDLLDWPEPIKIMQKNWIGRSEGAKVKFKIALPGSRQRRQEKEEKTIDVFTTRIDTIFGVNAVVLAPEHPFVKDLKDKILNLAEVGEYLETAAKKSELERLELTKEKTGVELKGIKAINPLSEEKIPVWIGDYVIAYYGGGAVMNVPAHDQRDYDFSLKYNLPIKEVIKGGNPEKDEKGNLLEAYEGEGVLVYSGKFSGLPSEKARESLTKYLEEKNLGGKKINYKLRDWIFSRQRYWGEPIPLVFCEQCKKRVESSKFQMAPPGSPLRRSDSEASRQERQPNSIKIENWKLKIENLQFTLGELLNPGWIALKEKDLPLVLPPVKSYQPEETGESPLAKAKTWLKTKCPKCKKEASREINTMPQWAGSCWYYLRYLDPKNKKALVDKKKEKYWQPVDLYVGGAEHAVLHLLYARFWHKFLYDLGVVSTPEPFMKLKNQGMVLGEDGEKMSKSRGNVVNPDEINKKYGTDVLRVYEMFMGPFEGAIPWSTQSIEGVNRFLKRIENLVRRKKKIDSKNGLERIRHQTIKRVTEDILNFKFNTAISCLMEYLNTLEEKEKEISRKDLEASVLLISPFVPHLGEELWHLLRPKLSKNKSIFQEKWPAYQEELAKKEEIELVIEINGKLRDKVILRAGLKEEEVKEEILKREKVKKYLENQKIKKIIFVQDRLINFVV